MTVISEQWSVISNEGAVRFWMATGSYLTTEH
jgi:hypothetical protein